jgi:hypothetical protein
MTALKEFASAAATAIYDAINAANAPDDLDQLARIMWRGYGEGVIGEDDAQILQSCIDQRRPLARNTPRTVPGRAIGKLAGRVGSRAISRQHPRSPDRKASRDRRRGQTKRGASKEPIDKERIRRSGEWLTRTCRANGVVGQSERFLPPAKTQQLKGPR